MHLLGVDIGTGKTAAVILGDDHTIAACASIPHKADLPTSTNRSEQDPHRLLTSAQEAVCSLPAKLRASVQAIGITGQMHGVVLLDSQIQAVNPLITWQDGRCLEDAAVLAALDAGTGHELRSGYGCASLLWLVRHGMLPSGASAAADIANLLAARWCGRRRAAIDPTFAASWGMFDIRAMDWDREALRQAGLPLDLLPTVEPMGGRAGALEAQTATSLGLPAGIPVMAAIGDNQASLIATLSQPDTDLALTLGTGGQLSAVVPRTGPWLAGGRSWECRPYPDDRLIAVAAALMGGAAWAWLKDAVADMQADMGLPPDSEDAIYARLDELGMAAEEALDVRPHFRGERHDPTLRGSISGLTGGNFRLGPLARGVAAGIVANLRDMLPAELLDGRRRIVASGNALRRSPLLRRMAEEVLGMPLVLAAGQEEAAAGAAVLAGRLASST